VYRIVIEGFSNTERRAVSFQLASIALNNNTEVGDMKRVAIFVVEIRMELNITKS
jgi:hypothetical protein